MILSKSCCGFDAVPRLPFAAAVPSSLSRFRFADDPPCFCLMISAYPEIIQP
jgi:hypothetical protein